VQLKQQSQHKTEKATDYSTNDMLDQAYKSNWNNDYLQNYATHHVIAY